MTTIYNKEKEEVTCSNSPDKRVWRSGDVVYKIDPTLDIEWKKKMQEILKIYDVPAFKEFIENGYVTHYIKGKDLHGSSPFSIDGDSESCILSPLQKLEAFVIFADTIRVGQQLGFTFGDVNLSNIIFDGKKFYLIDYDPISEYPLQGTNIKIYNYSLQLMFNGEI